MATMYFALGGATPMHKMIFAASLGALVALFLNKTIAGFVNILLTPLGASYV